MPSRRSAPPSKEEQGRKSSSAGAGGVLLFVTIVYALVRLGTTEFHKNPGTHPDGTATRALPKCPSGIEDEVGHIECGLPIGSAAFNAPATMTRGVSQVIALFVSVRDSARVLTEQVKTATGDTVSRVEVTRVKVSPRMVARLEGQGFNITPKASDAIPIAVSKRGFAEWEWQVTPTESGDQLLVLTLDAVIRLKTGDVPNRQTVLRRRIHVNVTIGDRMRDFGQFLKDYWSVILGLVALVGTVITFIRSKRGRRFFHRALTFFDAFRR